MRACFAPFLFLQVFARGQQQLRSRRESTGSDQATQPDAADASAMESSSRTSSPLPSSELSAAGCAVLWEDFPRHLRRSPTPSSSSESSGTTADTFLLEDVSSSVFLQFLALECLGLVINGMVIPLSVGGPAACSGFI
jgi:hypothetical protein